MRNVRLSFRSELFLRIGLCVAFALLLSSAVSISLDLHTSRSIIVESLRSHAAYLATSCRNAEMLKNSGPQDNATALLREDHHIISGLVICRTGATLASYSRDNRPVNPPPRREGRTYHTSDGTLHYFYDGPQGEDGADRVYLQRDLDDTKDSLTQAITASALILLASLGITMLIALWFQRALTRPIRELNWTASAVAKTRNFEVRARKFRSDELGLLTDGFNDMLNQIEARDRELTQARTELEARVQERTRELRQSEAHLRTAVSAAPFPAMIHADDGEIIMLSRSWTEITGYTREDIPDIQTWTAKAYGQRVDLMRDVIDGLYGMSTRSHDGEYQICTRGGELRVWDFSSAPLGKLPDGRRAVITMAMDITRRIESERRLADSVARLQLATQATQIGHWDWNIKTNQVYFSPEFKRQIGYEPDEFGDSFAAWETHLHPEDRAATLQAIEDYLSGRTESYRVVFRLRHKNGSYRWILTQAKKVLDADGAIERLIGCHVDVTLIKETEAELRKTTIFLDSILENIPNMIFVKEAEELRFVRFNRAGEELLGQARGDLIGKNDTDFFPPDEVEFFIRKDREVLESGRILDIPEESIHTATKGIRLLHTKKVPLRDDQGRPAYLLGISEDITERRQAERLLESTLADLKRSNRELEQFAYVASHDLQEPLRMVTSYLQLIEQRYRDQLDAEGCEFLHFAVDGAVRMRSLILDLLAYSRIGTRGTPPVPTASGEALDLAIKNLSVLIVENQAELEREPPDFPEVLAEISQLAQLFQNLIANAIKFHGPTPPRIRISAAPDTDPQFWRFTVADNGIGIDPEFHERIFVIFQRLHRRDQYPGTGIGLAICRKILERLGGRIWVESQSGEGSRFIFTLPSLPSA